MTALQRQTKTFQACDLPAGVEMFDIPMLNKIFSTSGGHWLALVECGEIGSVKLRSPDASKAVIRVPRASLVAFLEKRTA